MNSVMVSGGRWTGVFKGADVWNTKTVTIPTPPSGVSVMVQTINCSCLQTPINPIMTVTYKFSPWCKIDGKPVVESFSASAVLISKTRGWPSSIVTVNASFNIRGDSKYVGDPNKWLTQRGADKNNSISILSSGQTSVKSD